MCGGLQGHLAWDEGAGEMHLLDLEPLELIHRTDLGEQVTQSVLYPANRPELVCKSGCIFTLSTGQ